MQHAHHRRATSWKRRTRPRTTCTSEHDELFEAIRDGKPINNGEYMAKSTLLAIMGRMAAYTGKTITWDDADGIEGGPDAAQVRVRPPANPADRGAGADEIRVE